MALNGDVVRWQVPAILLALGMILTGATAKTKKEGRVSTNPLFERRVEVVSIPLAESKYGLTFEQGDMGPQVDWAPKPMVFDPKLGLYLVNPGPAAAPDPSLQRFGPDGARLFRTPLVQALGVADASTLVSHRLYLDATGESHLLFSTGYDSNAGLEKDFAMASFDASGKKSRVVKLVDFPFPERAYRGSDGTLWGFTSGKGTSPSSWAAYDSSGKQKFRFEGEARATILPDGALLALPFQAPAHVKDARNVQAPVEVRGKVDGLANDLVSGWGWLFGAVRQATVPGAGGAGEQMALVLQLLRFHREAGKAILQVDGEAPITESWADVDSDGSHPFTIFLPEWTRMDPNGDLYLLARRGPKNPAIVVYRMALKKDVRDRLLTR